MNARPHDVFLISSVRRLVWFYASAFCLYENTKVRWGFLRRMIIFIRCSFNCLRITFRDDAKDILVLRCYHGGRDKGGESKRQVDRYLVILFGNVFGSIRAGILMWILRRSFARVITFTSSSNVFNTRFIGINGYKARRKINECVARSTLIVGLFRSNLCQNGVTSSTVLKRDKRCLIGDVRHVFRNYHVSGRFKLRFFGLFRYNVSMNIMGRAGTFQICVGCDNFILRTRCVNGRKTRFANSWGWCSRQFACL